MEHTKIFDTRVLMSRSFVIGPGAMLRFGPLVTPLTARTAACLFAFTVAGLSPFFSRCTSCSFFPDLSMFSVFF